MKKLLCSCLAVGALAGVAIGHATVATASEPVSLTEDEMDGVTAGMLINLNDPQWLAKLRRELKKLVKGTNQMIVTVNGKTIKKNCPPGRSCALTVHNGKVKFSVH